MSDAGYLAAESHSMFSRQADWKAAVTVICDVMRGTSAIAVETHASSAKDSQRQTEVSKWRYEQTQPFRSSEATTHRLFTLEQLRGVLTDMSDADLFYVYEIDPAARFASGIENSLADFSSIEVSFVTLSVGDAVMAWVLVTLGQPRDLILWKMKYHLRDASL